MDKPPLKFKPFDWKINNKAQVSIEYLVLAGVGMIIAALITALIYNVFTMKEGMKELVIAYRNAFLSLK